MKTRVVHMRDLADGDWRRPVKKRDLGLMMWSGPIPEDEVRLFGRWFQVQAVWFEGGQPVYEMALL